MDFSDVESRMDKTISVMQENFSEIRAGRANPAILNKVKVEYYGVETPISQVARNICTRGKINSYSTMGYGSFKGYRKSNTCIRYWNYSK